MQRAGAVVGWLGKAGRAGVGPREAVIREGVDAELQGLYGSVLFTRVGRPRAVCLFRSQRG